MSLKSIEEVTHNVAGYEPQETTMNQRSISLSFSLQILAREGFSVRGDATMQKTATVPQRASKPVDIDQEYDDDSVGSMPRSAIRFRSTQQPQAAQTPTTGPIVAPIVTHRVSGSTRLGLYLLLFLCLAFLVNGLVLPAITDALTQLRYGDARIATYDLNGRHWITEEDNGRMRIVVSTPDGSHNQVLTTVVSGAPKHALVSLSPDGTKIDVSINGAYIALLVPDGSNGYTWGSN